MKSECENHHSIGVLATEPLKNSTKMSEKEGKKQKGNASGENPKQIFVRNLSFNTTNEDLLAAFEEFGPIKNSSIATSGDGKSRGFGFVK